MLIFRQFLFEKPPSKDNNVKIYIDECTGKKKAPLSWEKCIDLHLKT